MAGYVISYVATGAAFLVLDMLWLGVVARSFYRDRIGVLLLEGVNLPAAGAFYLLYVAGIVFFCVQPALQTESWRTVILHGALLGLLAYGTYDLTNLAVLKGWPVDVSLVDITWGMIITALSAYAGYLAARQFA